MPWIKTGGKTISSLLSADVYRKLNKSRDAAPTDSETGNQAANENLLTEAKMEKSQRRIKYEKSQQVS